jgi:glyoxylase-like metal-dependent hydrolase (beta-lactamase superfamily II)
MMRLSALAAALWVAVLCFAGPALANELPRLIKLADGVYAYEALRQPGLTTVSFIVVGRDGVLIADGQESPQAMTGLLRAIAQVSPLPVKWYVVGSDHADHTGGNSALPTNVTYIVHKTSKAQLERDGAPVPAAAMNGEKESIDVGGIEVQVRFLGRAHTGGDLVVYLPKQKILFMSEVFLNRVFPAMRSAYPREWVQVINRSLALDVERFVPGHGAIEPPAASRQALMVFQGALQRCIEEVTRLHRLGLSESEALQQANWGDMAGWALADSQPAIAVKRIYAELEGGLP